MKQDVSISPDDILIRSQDTPNPSAIKFIVNFALKDVGNATYTSKEEAAHLPLVAAMFDILGVNQVYLFQNTLTVTHTEELPPEMVKEHVKSVIKTRLVQHNPEFSSPEEEKAQQKPDRSSLPDDVREIEEVLDRTIRPGLQADGGDVEVLEFSNNELRIMYQGACGGCPSAMMGTLEAIQSILRNELKNEEIIVTPI